MASLKASSGGASSLRRAGLEQLGAVCGSALESPSPWDARRPGLREPLWAFAAATALAAGLTALGAVEPFVRDNSCTPPSPSFSSMRRPSRRAARGGSSTMPTPASGPIPIGLNLAVLGSLRGAHPSLRSRSGSSSSTVTSARSLGKNQMTRLPGGLCRLLAGAGGAVTRLPPRFLRPRRSVSCRGGRRPSPEELFFRRLPDGTAGANPCAADQEPFQAPRSAGRSSSGRARCSRFGPSAGDPQPAVGWRSSSRRWCLAGCAHIARDRFCRRRHLSRALQRRLRLDVLHTRATSGG